MRKQVCRKATLKRLGLLGWLRPRLKNAEQKNHQEKQKSAKIIIRSGAICV
jgi:hypothetical protein